MAFSPVSRILSNIFDDWGGSRLGELTSRIVAEPFDLKEFRAKIVKKLDRTMPRGRAHASRISFSDRLKQTHSLATVLNDSTLQELRNRLLIPKIFDRDRELERKWLSAGGLPLRTHLKSANEAQARMHEIERRAEIEGKSTDTEEYRRLNRQFRDDMILVILSKRHPGKRKQLLTGQPLSNLKRQPRQKAVAVNRAVFRILRARLSDNVSDRFIHLLATLIGDPRPDIADTILLRAAEALRKAIADDPAG